MSVPREPKRAKLFVSVIAAASECIARVLLELTERHGPMDFVSAVLPFDCTDYYHAEMGMPLWRRFVSFVRLISQGDLVRIKEESNELEEKMSEGGRRTVNVDPGYLVAERLVLATGKNSAHRIYLDRGIYADLTLVFHQKEYRPLPWTYPDYGDTMIRGFLGILRQKYLLQLREEQPQSGIWDSDSELRSNRE